MCGRGGTRAVYRLVATPATNLAPARGKAPVMKRIRSGRCIATTVVAIAMVFSAATAYAAVTPIPPADYPPGCDPDGLALQGDAANDSMDGTPQRDLLRGGDGIDEIRGFGDSDCLAGQGGLFDDID